MITGIKEYRLIIYNRWGKLVFDEFGENPVWDGNFKNGLECQSGSYSYIINYTTYIGESYSTNGVIILIR